MSEKAIFIMYAIIIAVGMSYGFYTVLTQTPIGH